MNATTKSPTDESTDTLRRQALALRRQIEALEDDSHESRQEENHRTNAREIRDLEEQRRVLCRELANRGEYPNPVIKTTPIRVASGWVAREYYDGMYDAIQSNDGAMSCGLASFQAAVDWAKDEATGLDPIARVNDEGTGYECADATVIRQARQ